jgi:rhamnose utilization protein RhaD (predicted bifunctional aldolase and dehydrogenase)/NAD(P)-dependent dehydrogenase (short-subunit alcohol dehydrogenase family)
VNESHPILRAIVEASQRLGADASLVLHGGGNTSAKGTITDVLGRERSVIWIKGSGWDLGTIEAGGFPACDLDALRSLRSLDDMSDEAMVREVRATMLDTAGPTPSIEALLHAFLPHRFVLHSHADAIIAVSNRADGEAICRDLFGDRLVHIPYIMPGFPLAKAVAEAVDAKPDVVGALLHQHGLFTFAQTADEALSRHRELVDLAAARYADGAVAEADVVAATHAASALLPPLRGALSVEHPMVLDVRDAEWIRAALAEPDAREVLCTPSLTPDHTIRTKPWPCWIDADPADVGPGIAEAVAAYAERYTRYVDAGIAARGPRDPLDPMPRVVLVPGFGLVTAGVNALAAATAADIAEHTIATKMASRVLGPYQGLPDLDLFDMEYWPLEQAKLARFTPRELEGRIAVVTGGGGAIGEGVARVLLDAGAAVALLDINEDLAAAAAERLGGPVWTIAADVTCERSMARAMDAVCSAFGGIDIVVPNAGISHSASIASHDVDAFRRVVDVNLNGVFHTLQSSIRVMRRQGTGGSVVIVSSKNVLMPGAEFSAYSASKAGAHQLGKVAALEFAGDDIAVNMVCPDAVFGSEDNPSGLWQEVGPDRARAKGIEVDTLAAHYRDRNMLKSLISAEDVGHAVLFFAARRTPTTGCLITVDGGVPGGFPR